MTPGCVAVAGCPQESFPQLLLPSHFLSACLSVSIATSSYSNSFNNLYTSTTLPSKLPTKSGIRSGPSLPPLKKSGTRPGPRNTSTGSTGSTSWRGRTSLCRRGTRKNDFTHHHHHHHHPEGVVYRTFRLNSSTSAASEIASRRWWHIESLSSQVQIHVHGRQEGQAGAARRDLAGSSFWRRCVFNLGFGCI